MKAMVFVQEFVLLFGFLSGYWIYAGVNPETEILKAFLEVIVELAPSIAPGVSLISWMIPIVLIIGCISTSLAVGGWIGLLAVGLAFVGGLMIESIGVYLLLIAILIGLFATSAKESF